MSTWLQRFHRKWLKRTSLPETCNLNLVELESRELLSSTLGLAILPPSVSNVAIVRPLAPQVAALPALLTGDALTTTEILAVELWLSVELDTGQLNLPDLGLSANVGVQVEVRPSDLAVPIGEIGLDFAVETQVGDNTPVAGEDGSGVQLGVVLNTLFFGALPENLPGQTWSPPSMDLDFYFETAVNGPGDGVFIGSNDATTPADTDSALAADALFSSTNFLGFVDDPAENSASVDSSLGDETDVSVSQTVVETDVTDSTDFAWITDTAPVPEAEGTLAELSPINLESLEQALAQLVTHLKSLGQSLNDMGVYPWVVVVIVAALAFELGRRHVRSESETEAFPWRRGLARFT